MVKDTLTGITQRPCRSWMAAPGEGARPRPTCRMLPAASTSMASAHGFCAARHETHDISLMEQSGQGSNLIALSSKHGRQGVSHVGSH